MWLIDLESRECLKSELELFTTPLTQTSIEKTGYVNVYPVTALQLNGPLEFVLAPSSEHYIDLQKTILYLKCKIMLKDGNSIVKKESTDPGFNKTLVAPICYFHATQFKGVEVFLNSVPVTHLDNLYPYRAYLETLLTFGSESKEGQLQSALFYKDAGEHNWMEAGLAKTPPAGEDNPRWTYIKPEIKNPGARERFQCTKYSRAFETFGRIHNELFTQGKLLPGGCELRIRLHRADPQFCLMAKNHDENYVVQIEKAILMVRQCRISSAIRESHARMRLEKPIKYPTRKVQMKFFTKGTGISDLSEPNLVNGILPRRIVIGFVDSSAFNGHLGKKPFKFEHVQIRSITLRRDGDAVPFESIEMDQSSEENKCFQQGYLSLLQGTGRLYQDQGFHITPEEYINGNALFAFDLSRDNSGCGQFDLLEEGRIGVEVKLQTATTKATTMIVYMETDHIYAIDKEGNLIEED